MTSGTVTPGGSTAQLQPPPGRDSQRSRLGSKTAPRLGWASKTASTAARIPVCSKREPATRTSSCAQASRSLTNGIWVYAQYDDVPCSTETDSIAVLGG